MLISALVKGRIAGERVSTGLIMMLMHSNGMPKICSPFSLCEPRNLVELITIQEYNKN